MSLPEPRKPSKKAAAEAALQREAVLLMRSLKVAEEKAHEAGRKWETKRPEVARRLFELGRQAFQVHKVMQQSWATASPKRRSQLADAATKWLRTIEEAI